MADYERAIQDPSLRDLAIEGASLANFHALFHPSYPNYLAMIAVKRILACTAAHRTIADRLIAAGVDFKHMAKNWLPVPAPGISRAGTSPIGAATACGATCLPPGAGKMVRSCDRRRLGEG